MAATESADERFLQNHAWFDQHIQDLVKQYHGQFVAVDHGKVVAAAKDVGEITRRLGPLQGILVARVLPPEEDEEYVL